MKIYCRCFKNSEKFKVSCLFIIIALAISFVHVSLSCAEVLTLSDGLKRVTEDNRLLKITQGDERISVADTYIAWSRLLPEVNTSAGYTVQAYKPQAIFGPQTVPVSEKDFFNYSLKVQQTLYDFKGNASRYEASRAVLNTKKFETARVKNLVSLDFLLIYFDLLESEKMLVVAQKEVERFESHLRDAKNLYEEGVITKNDLLQAEVRISDAKQRLVSAKNLRALNASRLNTILARPLTEDVQPVDQDKKLSDTLLPDTGKAWEMAEKQRPEIMIVDETLRSLDLGKKSKQSEYYPRFFAEGGYDFIENRYMVHEGNWSLILGLGWNLFRGGATKAEILKIESQKQQLFEQKNKILDDIRLEVEKYQLDLRNAQERIAVTKDAVQQADENLRINRLKYEEGVGTATDVIDAVTLLAMAETNYYRALYDLRRAEGAFLYATGRELAEVYQ